MTLKRATDPSTWVRDTTKDKGAEWHYLDACTRFPLRWEKIGGDKEMDRWQKRYRVSKSA